MTQRGNPNNEKIRMKKENKNYGFNRHRNSKLNIILADNIDNCCVQSLIYLKVLSNLEGECRWFKSPHFRERLGWGRYHFRNGLPADVILSEDTFVFSVRWPRSNPNTSLFRSPCVSFARSRSIFPRGFPASENLRQLPPASARRRSELSLLLSAVNSSPARAPVDQVAVLHIGCRFAVRPLLGEGSLSPRFVPSLSLYCSGNSFVFRQTWRLLRGIIGSERAVTRSSFLVIKNCET